MHPTATHTEFLRLRTQGLSLAAISRRLGVSKPTLIAWSRKAQPDLEAAFAAHQQQSLQTLGDTAAQELADLTRGHNFLKQELLSRAFRNIPTAHLEQLAGEFHRKIEDLKRTCCPAKPASNILNPSSIQNPQPIRA